MKYVTNLDLNKNELQNAVLHPLAAPPVNPRLGQIYYNSSDKFVYKYDGVTWSPVGVIYNQGSTTGAVVTGLSGTGGVTTNNVIELTLTGYSPVSEGYVTTGMSLQQAIAALDAAIKNAIAGGGEVNQEAWSYIGVGSSTISATAKKDTFNVAATGGATVSANTSTKTITVNVPVDSSMSSTSTNPVQNKVVKTYVDTKYTKPSDGIPKTDLTAAVQESLDKADNALQEESVTDVTINGTSILDNTVAKIVYETGLGSDSNNAATVTAIRNFVNSSIESVAAYYITSDAQGDAFATKAALDAGPYYYAGTARTPTRNDYAIVIADETHDGHTARYAYTDNQWAFQYTFNMGFTQAQINAINSGITAAKVTSYDNHIASTSNPHSVTKAQVGLSNVGNFKAVSTVANQGLSVTEQANARANIGAGTSSFSGDYDDLTDKPTITLNGSAIKSPSFYAPTGAGSSGQVLTSSGSGAPSWQTPIKKYTATNPTLTASGGAWTWTISASTHGINNNAIIVNLYEVSTNAQVIADVAVNATNYGITVTIVDSGNASSLVAGTYRIVAIG